jgi:hypothetical protein
MVIARSLSDEAIQADPEMIEPFALDCFASLAMTASS